MNHPPEPTVYVIAGPNGAGKTTFALKYLPRFVDCPEFVNADLIASGLSPFNPESQAAMAGRLMLRRLDELSSARTTFGFETTLSGRTHARRLQVMKRRYGYRLAMFFIWLPSVEQAIARVAARVREGGHDIPEPTIRRRYRQGITNFGKLYAPLLDQWVVYDGSDRPAVKIVGEVDGNRTIFDAARFTRLLQRSPGLIT
ncbi:AAA family ATPase [Candidatus Laterigemmans baculatus]|uniref:AAA family ATPase n=1 Tax=Candidatus Laterigemmans baculatus TaxID=2770505 RepID=UPI0013DC319F|nr:AAA family ATPase [Candidatus Laterigemmans baculatus]